MLIRHADPVADAAACAAIYAVYVSDGLASLETVVPSTEEFRGRMERISPRYPYLVAEEGGAVVGYASGDPNETISGANAAIALDPGRADYWNYRGLGFQLRGQFAKAACLGPVVQDGFAARADHGTNDGRTDAARPAGDQHGLAVEFDHPCLPRGLKRGRLMIGFERPFLTLKYVPGRTLEALLAARPDPARDRAAFLHAVGLETSLQQFAPDRANLIARIGGVGSKLPLCFTGHVDTVPLGNASWSVDAFAGDKCQD